VQPEVSLACSQSPSVIPDQSRWTNSTLPQLYSSLILSSYLHLYIAQSLSFQVFKINLHAFLIPPIRVTCFYPSNLHIIARQVKSAIHEYDHYAILWSPYSFLSLRSKYSPQRWVLSLTVSSLFVMVYRSPNGKK
jgi:hypothetical protein